MEELAVEFNRGKKRSKTQEYTNLTNKVRYWRDKKYDQIKPAEFKELLNKLTSTPSMARNEKYTRLHYVRYADDFVIGVEGSYEQAKSILDKVTNFVEDRLSLKFNPDKGITKYTNAPVKFLGYSIAAPHLKGINKPIENITLGGKNIMRRKKIRIRVFMDLQKVLKRMEARGIIRKRTSHKNRSEQVFRGRYIGNLINLDHADIIRHYNSIIRGIYNYYDFTGNRNDVLYSIWLVKESCALTLAMKYKVGTMSKIFRKFGPDLACEINTGKEVKTVSLIRTIDLVKGELKHTKNPNPVNNLEKQWNAKFTKTNLNKICIICGESSGVEMHHVRHIKDLSKNSKLDFFTRQMRAINRKQIPLCKSHHIGLHKDS